MFLWLKETQIILSIWFEVSTKFHDSKINFAESQEHVTLGGAIVIKVA